MLYLLLYDDWDIKLEETAITYTYLPLSLHKNAIYQEATASKFHRKYELTGDPEKTLFLSTCEFQNYYITHLSKKLLFFQNYQLYI